MSFFKSKQSSSEQPIDNDGSGFLHPESSLSSNRDLDTTSWSKERTSQQLELENNLHNSTSNQNCCSKLIEYTIKSLFVIDICIGITLIIYGSLILTQFDKESVAMAAVIFCLLFGSKHFTSCIVL